MLEHGNAGAIPVQPGMGTGTGTSGLSMVRGGEEMNRPAKYMRTGGFEGGAGTSRIKHNEVDQSALKKSFLNMVKSIYDSSSLKRNYFADGKQGRLQCLACNRCGNMLGLYHVSNVFRLLICRLNACFCWFSFEIASPDPARNG